LEKIVLLGVLAGIVSAADLRANSPVTCPKPIFVCKNPRSLVREIQYFLKKIREIQLD
jgi:hypothetical protein